MKKIGEGNGGRALRVGYNPLLSKLFLDQKIMDADSTAAAAAAGVAVTRVLSRNICLGGRSSGENIAPDVRLGNGGSQKS